MNSHPCQNWSLLNWQNFSSSLTNNKFRFVKRIFLPFAYLLHIGSSYACWNKPYCYGAHQLMPFNKNWSLTDVFLLSEFMNWPLRPNSTGECFSAFIYLFIYLCFAKVILHEVFHNIQTTHRVIVYLVSCKMVSLINTGFFTYRIFDNK